jgi:hypothetical protein
MAEIPKASAVHGLNELIRAGEICSKLRSKKMFYQADEEASEVRYSGPFWCARTQSLIGFDGRIAGQEECRPGRSCCETT